VSHVRHRDVIGALLFLGLGLIGLFFSYRLDRGTVANPGAGFLPFNLSMLLVALSLHLFFRSWRAPSATDEGGADRTRWKRLGVALAGLVAYAYVVKPLGFVISSMLVLVVLLRFVEERPWTLTLPIAVSFPVVLYIVSVKYLSVPLPRGILPF
jgi:putative tricarboxylic transport membrane protein